MGKRLRNEADANIIVQALLNSEHGNITVEYGELYKGLAKDVCKQILSKGYNAELSELEGGFGGWCHEHAFNLQVFNSRPSYFRVLLGNHSVGSICIIMLIIWAIISLSCMLA